LRYDDLRGVPAKPRDRENTIAGREPGNARSDGVNDPRNLVTDNQWRLWRIRIQANPCENVGKIHARSSHSNARLAARRGRRRRLSRHQHIRRTIAGKDNLTNHLLPEYIYFGGFRMRQFLAPLAAA